MTSELKRIHVGTFINNHNDPKLCLVGKLRPPVVLSLVTIVKFNFLIQIVFSTLRTRRVEKFMNSSGEQHNSTGEFICSGMLSKAI